METKHCREKSQLFCDVFVCLLLSGGGGEPPFLYMETFNRSIGLPRMNMGFGRGKKLFPMTVRNKASVSGRKNCRPL